MYGDITLIDSIVSRNHSDNDGGGIRTSAGDITLIGSTISENSTGDNAGGIRSSDGAVKLINSTVSGNTAEGYGGGIRTSSGHITLIGSTLSGNTADEEGGGIRTTSGLVTLIGSTVSGNTSGEAGGGIRSFYGNIALTGSTITNNSADQGGGIFVVEIVDHSDFNVTNSIIAGNSAMTSGPDLQTVPNSTLNIDYSLIGDTTDSGIDATTGTGNLLNQDAMLGELQDNGGPTQTHALLTGSPALDAGNESLIPSGVATDQRGDGFPRVVGGTVDIGAFESEFGSVNGYFVSSDTGGIVSHIVFDDEDILAYQPDSGQWSMYFEWYLDGSDVGLSPTAEDINAITLDPSGRLVVSTVSNHIVPTDSGTSSGTSDDLIVFDATQLGADSIGTWEKYFDGSDVGITGDVNAFHIDSSGDILISLRSP